MLHRTHGTGIITAITALVLSAGTTLAQQNYVFDTTTGQITGPAGTPVTSFNGVQIADRGFSGSTRRWTVQGNMTFASLDYVRVTGAALARIDIAGNLYIPGDAVLDAGSGHGFRGPGGGLGGAGGEGGAGGTGGAGASNGAAGDQGINGGFLGNLGNGGPGGFTPVPGGAGGSAFTPSAGTAGNRRTGGSPGMAGFPGMPGQPGQQGVNNMSTAGWGGAAGTGGAGGFGGPAGVTESAGGPGGGPGSNGTAGTAGETGANGGSGQLGVAPGFGTVPGAIVTAGNDMTILVGGNGGGGAGGLGGTGGGGGGSSGGGGGGGGGGGQWEFGHGGGGGGGGAGGGGGRGADGLHQSAGFNGGAGGGGLQLVVQGRIDLEGAIYARGESVSNPVSMNNIPGSAGGTGGAGGTGASRGTVGGSGGRGGDGGSGGASPSTAGARPGAGGGGSIFLNCTTFAYNFFGTVITYPGFGGQTNAPNGRVLLSEANSGAPLIIAQGAQLIRSLSSVPQYTSPYFPGLVTPNIVPNNRTLSGIDHGPSPFGLLPSTLNDPTINAARANAPARARWCIIRSNTGPAGFTNTYNLDSAVSTVSRYDSYVLVNLTSDDSPSTFNNVALSAIRPTTRTEYGGSGAPSWLDLQPMRSWICLGPATGDVDVSAVVGIVGASFTLPDPTEGSVVRYALAPCGRADVGVAGGSAGADGVLDNNDFIAFINLFFAADPRADVGRAGGLATGDGQFDNNDFIAFINHFFAGC